MPFITQVLIPKCDNSGRPFEKEVYLDFHTRMLQRFGGWTRKGQAEGAWLSPSGRLFTEEHWVYEIGHSRRDLRFGRKKKNGSVSSLTRKSSGLLSTKAVRYSQFYERYTMPHTSPSALITDNGRLVHLRLQGRFYELTQEELRALLGLPPGPPGLGITIDRERLHVEFAGARPVEISATQLQRRLAKQLAAKS
jgi:hypothetical protein